MTEDLGPPIIPPLEITPPPTGMGNRPNPSRPEPSETDAGNDESSGRPGETEEGGSGEAEESEAGEGDTTSMNPNPLEGAS